ncbi:MAG: N-acetylmuramoyl-L-alanine amidase [Nitrospirae bacterium]|nr:N-acetylmuramoyl-L-alanine amidase [Nitrospirota bacterium]
MKRKKTCKYTLPLFIALFVFATPAFSIEKGGNSGVISLIVLDPGHGGFDTGAKGPTGLEEKDVALAVAKRLKELLEKGLNAAVLLTRDGDFFLPLEDRTLFANKNNAEIFISIHANAARKNAADGFETYFLGLEASDDDARTVALYENSIRNMGKGALREGDDLGIILGDMLNTAVINESSILAETIQNGFGRIMAVKNRGVKQAPFIVLMNAMMPAVLTEIAFISNPEQEKRLKDKAFLDKIAEALYNSINEYKKSYELRVAPIASHKTERGGSQNR